MDYEKILNEINSKKYNISILFCPSERGYIIDKDRLIIYINENDIEFIKELINKLSNDEIVSVLKDNRGYYITINDIRINFDSFLLKEMLYISRDSIKKYNLLLDNRGICLIKDNGNDIHAISEKYIYEYLDIELSEDDYGNIQIYNIDDGTTKSIILGSNDKNLSIYCNNHNIKIVINVIKNLDCMKLEMK